MNRVLLPLLGVLCAAASASAALQPFRMPWNDSTAGVTNLQSWQPTSAGARGWVEVNADGRYEVGGERIRFLGVNVTAADCFPPHERAEAHAARLARFGFNAVRFHHMEAQWDKANVIIDYAKGNSRSLAADRLERLHYFVAKLAERGIHTNLNLLVSREFQPGDGLGSEIAQLGWKDQHILGFFMDEALALHREYATALLSAPNPHRGGKSLAQDPAVAFVEIMNENGLAQKWYEGVLDTLPAPYLTALRGRWNAWLQTRYPSTSELLTAWNVINEPLGPNRIVNGTFASGNSSWNLERHDAAAATSSSSSDFNGSPALRVDVTAGGTAGWHVQVTQLNHAVQAGHTYTLSFWAKAATATPLSATFTRTGPTDYSGIHSSLNATLGTTWKQYSTTFQASSSESNVRLVFNGFGDQIAAVWLADVRFSEGGAIGGLPAGASLEAGNIPAAQRNAGSATAAQTRDWMAFMFEAERKYWEAMKAHVVSTVGYAGVVWGTIISNSPPNTQARLDAMDSHAYWQHPQFAAGRDWDPELWTVTNTSMVNAPGANTLTGIARQRVKGYPHNVTEYQHSSPNTYASEGPLLAASYGALQDWDSLWMFDYKTGSTEYVTGHLDHGGHVGKMANNLLAACLFRRGDVAPAKREYTLALTSAQEAETARARGSAWSIADASHLGMPGTLAFESRLSLSIGDSALGLASVPTAPSGAVITADTGEIRWDTSRANQGVVTINSPKTKAVVGFVGARSFDLGGVVIAPGATRQDWCTVGLALLEGQSFATAASARGVIVATGDQENTGQVWKDASRTSVGSRWGGAPVLVEVVPATITLPVSASRVSVWALDATGQRGTAVSVRNSGGKAQFDLGQSGITVWYEFEIRGGATAAPVINRAPAHTASAPGATASVSVLADANPAPVITWYRNGTLLAGANEATLRLENFSPDMTGLYQPTLTNSMGSRSTNAAIVALATDAKVVGATREVASNVFVATNGNTYDQLLLEGKAASFTADVALTQITRMSFIDLDDDIVQVEMSGPGTLSLVLDTPTGPAAPVNYNQSQVSYMKGHAGIVITGADERTNLSVFSVGRLTAFDPTHTFKITEPISATNHPSKNGSPLFVGHTATAYDGIADVGFVAIASNNGKFGGLRAANVNFFAARGLTGVYAPDVSFSGPVYVGDIIAADDATPVLMLGSATDTRITGGDLLQQNGQPVRVSGLTQLKFTPGTDSHGTPLLAQRNQAVLQENGSDVTTKIVVDP